MIDYNLADQEQYNSLIVMHASSLKRITVIIDCLDMKWFQTLKKTSNVRFTSIVDGLRLWKTLPYRIERVFILSTSNSILNNIIKLFLPKKIKEKTHILKSWEDLSKVNFSYTPVTHDDCNHE